MRLPYGTNDCALLNRFQNPRACFPFFFLKKETETCLKPQAQNIGEKRLNLLFDACDDSSAAMCLRAQ